MFSLCGLVSSTRKRSLLVRASFLVLIFSPGKHYNKKHREKRAGQYSSRAFVLVCLVSFSLPLGIMV